MQDEMTVRELFEFIAYYGSIALVTWAIMKYGFGIDLLTLG